MKIFFAMIAAVSVLSGCVVAPYPNEPGHHRGDAYHRDGDRDRDGVPNRYDRDRDGDGVSNRQDRRPNNPNRN